jgi:nucleotide-binding universal stress UspA family protein
MEKDMNSTSVLSITRPKSILVATDLNDLDFVLPVAIDQARITGAMIWLLHVIPPHGYLSKASEAKLSVIEEQQFRDAEATLARFAQQVRERNVACVCDVRRWHPVEQIVEFVHEHRFGRLIVGTASRGKLGKLIIGSVAEKLIRTVDIPVCTVGPHVTSYVQDNPRRMIVALSLRHHPERSLAFAAGLAAELRAELTVLHVAEQDRGDEGNDAGARSKIGELLRGIELHPAPQIRTRGGEPVEEIIAECAALKPQSLVLSARPTSALSTKFRNGVVYRVIAQAPCPTFTLRSGSKIRTGGNYREFSAVCSGPS